MAVVQSPSLYQLHAISTVPTTAEDLAGSAEEILAQIPNAAPARVIIRCVAQRYRGDMDKAAAIFFRLQALARVLRRLPPVVGSSADEEWAHTLFAAAAVHPLVQIGQRVTFERKSFLAHISVLRTGRATPRTNHLH